MFFAIPTSTDTFRSCNMYACIIVYMIHVCKHAHVIVLSDSKSQALVPPLEVEVCHVMEEDVRSMFFER